MTVDKHKTHAFLFPRSESSADISEPVAHENYLGAAV